MKAKSGMRQTTYDIAVKFELSHYLKRYTHGIMTTNWNTPDGFYKEQPKWIVGIPLS